MPLARQALASGVWRSLPIVSPPQYAAGGFAPRWVSANSVACCARNRQYLNSAIRGEDSARSERNPAQRGRRGWGTVMETLGDRIKRRRLELGLTQKQLGEAVNRSVQLISDWEANRRRPSIDVMPRLAAVLQMSLQELFDADPLPPGAYP